MLEKMKHMTKYEILSEWVTPKLNEDLYEVITEEKLRKYENKYNIQRLSSPLLTIIENALTMANEAENADREMIEKITDLSPNKNVLSISSQDAHNPRSQHLQLIAAVVLAKYSEKEITK